MERVITSGDYHDYVIKDGEFVGEFEQMYRNIEDPWHCRDLARNLDNDLLIATVRHAAADARGVFEVGCGLGWITEKLAQALPGAEMHACDVSPTALAKAKTRVPGCHFFIYDLCGEAPLPLPPGSVDLVVMVQVTWYILPALERTFAQLFTVLRRGGHLVVTQAFYPSAVQKYGRGILETTSDATGFLRRAGFTVRSEVHLDPPGELGRPHNSIFWAVKR